MTSRDMGRPSYPPYPPYPPQKPPVSGGDLAVSIIALTITVGLGAVAAVFGLFSFAFLDFCPPESCSAEGAPTAVGMALLIAFAIATLVPCTLAVFLGGVGYAMAVGA